MSYQIQEKNGKKYIESIPGEFLLESEREALDLVAACGENETSLLMLHEANLTEDFYRLRTGLAGAVLLKFVNYGIRTAAVISPERIQGRFQEMVLETNRGREFRVYEDREKAEQWLTEG